MKIYYGMGPGTWSVLEPGDPGYEPTDPSWTPPIPPLVAGDPTRDAGEILASALWCGGTILVGFLIVVGYFMITRG